MSLNLRITKVMITYNPYLSIKLYTETALILLSVKIPMHKVIELVKGIKIRVLKQGTPKR